LSLTILSQSLLNVAGESEIEGLKITIDEKEIAEPALIVLKVENDGIIPIRSDDFESDLEIILEGDINLIRASVIQTRPEWIKPSILTKDSIISIASMLLNPNESITVNILTEGLPTLIETRSRIA